MKTYTILGHVFELEHRAHLFLSHYIKRIDDYSKEHNIGPEIVEDLKYNIIEKLYTSQTPISEQYVMTVASDLGEPEAIFGNGEDQEETPKNLMEEWFGRNKPMLRGVCYWIAKSFGLPIMIVRLVMLGSLFMYGTGFWLYPILALFVPFQDKKSSSGSLGNIFFEFLRVIIWGAIIVMIGSIILGVGAAFIFGISIPTIGNQSLLMTIPTHLYVLAGLSAIALITLFGAAVSALFKKYWLPKGFALASLLILVISFIAAGTFTYQKFMDYSNHYISSEEFDRTIALDNITIEDQQIILNLDRTIYRQFSQRLRGWNINEEIQHIEIIPSSNEQIQITVHDNIADLSASINQPWTTLDQPSIEGNIINLKIPELLFTKKVPFIGAYRTITIAIPQNKELIINNNTDIQLRKLSPRGRYDTTTNTEISCTDYKHFLFNNATQRWECANQQTDTQPISTQTNTYSPEIVRSQVLLNLTEEQARKIVEQQGLKLRVTERNGIEIPILHDDLPNHIDVELRNGRVIDVDSEMISVLPTIGKTTIKHNTPTPSQTTTSPTTTTSTVAPHPVGPSHIPAPTIDIEDQLQQQYRGLTLQQAQELAAKTNTPIRVVEEDGIDLPITKDFAKGRINLEISNGKVIDLDVEGY